MNTSIHATHRRLMGHIAQLCLHLRQAANAAVPGARRNCGVTHVACVCAQQTLHFRVSSHDHMNGHCTEDQSESAAAQHTVLGCAPACSSTQPQLTAPCARAQRAFIQHTYTNHTASAVNYLVLPPTTLPLEMQAAQHCAATAFAQTWQCRPPPTSCLSAAAEMP